MADETSFVITHLIDALGESMPDAEAARLQPYRDRAQGTGADDRAEWHRAFLCARWADRVASLPEHRHLAQEASRSAEVVRLLGGAVATELGRLVPEAGWKVSAGFAVEIAWVYEAARVAAHVAELRGWSEVPWQQLLEELLAVPSAPVS